MFAWSAPPDPKEQVKKWKSEMRAESRKLDRQINSARRSPHHRMSTPRHEPSIPMVWQTALRVNGAQLFPSARLHVRARILATLLPIRSQRSSAKSRK